MTTENSNQVAEQNKSQNENQDKSQNDSQNKIIAAIAEQSQDDSELTNQGFDGNSFNSASFDRDNGVALSEVLSPYFRPDEQTVVCGALDIDKVSALAKAGVDVVVNFQPEDELTFDEKSAVETAGMAYETLPIRNAEDLKQLNILALDHILRQHHGKKIVMHCKSGNRVGAAAALRAGWLRGRKIDTAMERGRSHGLTGLEEEVYNRLLVPR